MSESVRRLRANRPLEGRACGWCGKPLAFGDPAAVCTACETAVHAECWDREHGCPTALCVNQPLQKLAEPAPAATEEIPAHQMKCPHCGFLIPADSTLCSYCNMVPTPDGVYRGPKTNAPGAVASVVYGVLGLFICGLIFGILAISKANEAKKAIAADPRLGGAGLANTGRVLGILALVFFGLFLLIRLAAVSTGGGL
jgi:hypothetical protein